MADTQYLKSAELIRGERGKLTYVENWKIEEAYPPDGIHSHGPSWTDTRVFLGATLYVIKKAVQNLSGTHDHTNLTVTWQTLESTHKEPTQENIVIWSTDLGTATQHITNVESAAKRTNYPATGLDMPDGFTAIGWQSDGTVEGVDIIVPATTMTARVLKAASFYSAAYQALAGALRGKTNNAIFRNWAIGEVLFIGLREDPAGQSLVDLTYEFIIESNKTGISTDTILGGVQSVDKGGHQYLWGRSGQGHIDGDAAKDVDPGILSVHVDTLYNAGDFSTLGIGT